MLYFVINVVNLLLCPVYKLNFIISIYVCKGKNTVHVGFSSIQFQTSTGGLGTQLPEIKGDYNILKNRPIKHKAKTDETNFLHQFKHVNNTSPPYKKKKLNKMKINRLFWIHQNEVTGKTATLKTRETDPGSTENHSFSATELPRALDWLNM